MPKQRKWCWVTATPAAIYVHIWSGPKRPKYDEAAQSWRQPSPYDMCSLCATEFYRVTGLRISPRHPVKVAFTAKILNAKPKVKK